MQRNLKKAAYDFQQVNELRAKIQSLEDQTQRRIKDQQGFIKWINKIKIQNEGIIKVHDEEFVYDINSLYIFSYKNRLRKALVWFAEWKWFDRFVVFLIFIASLCQASSDNLDPDGR